MVRWLSFAGFIALIAMGWLLFELTNIWPFNAEKILLLRAGFFGFAVLATGAFLFGRWRLLPAALTFGAFASTSAFSNATTNPAYVASAGVIVLLVALLSRLFGSPLKSASRPNPT